MNKELVNHTIFHCFFFFSAMCVSSPWYPFGLSSLPVHHQNLGTINQLQEVFSKTSKFYLIKATTVKIALYFLQKVIDRK